MKIDFETLPEPTKKQILILRKIFKEAKARAEKAKEETEA